MAWHQHCGCGGHPESWPAYHAALWRAGWKRPVPSCRKQQVCSLRLCWTSRHSSCRGMASLKTSLPIWCSGKVAARQLLVAFKRLLKLLHRCIQSLPGNSTMAARHIVALGTPSGKLLDTQSESILLICQMHLSLLLQRKCHHQKFKIQSDDGTHFGQLLRMTSCSTTWPLMKVHVYHQLGWTMWRSMTHWPSL